MDMIKTLCSFASKDVTRYHLNGIYRDENYFVSTDGHRLIRVKPSELPYEHFKPGFIYETGVFLLGAIKTIDAKYPNTEQLIPDVTKDYKSFKITIPHWFKNLKNPRRGLELPSLGITETGDFTTSRTALAHVNACLLSPLAGINARVFVKNPLSAIVIVPEGTAAADIKQAAWLSLVMPLDQSKNRG